MDYEWDIFISYRRYGEWPSIVKDTIIPVFKHYFGEALYEQCLKDSLPDREPAIFIDNTIEEGRSWPTNLAYALAKSRIMVPLWTPSYFYSDWCLAELSLMYAREHKCGYRSKSCLKRLIVPASMHDGDNFPSEAKRVQFKHLSDYCIPNMPEKSQTKVNLAKRIQEWNSDADSLALDWLRNWLENMTDPVKALKMSAINKML